MNHTLSLFVFLTIATQCLYGTEGLERYIVDNYISLDHSSFNKDNNNASITFSRPLNEDLLLLSRACLLTFKYINKQNGKKGMILAKPLQFRIMSAAFAKKIKEMLPNSIKKIEDLMLPNSITASNFSTVMAYNVFKKIDETFEKKKDGENSLYYHWVDMPKERKSQLDWKQEYVDSQYLQGHNKEGTTTFNGKLKIKNWRILENWLSEEIKERKKK